MILEHLWTLYFQELNAGFSTTDECCKLHHFCAVHRKWGEHVWDDTCQHDHSEQDSRQTCKFIIQFKCFINQHSVYAVRTPPHGFMKRLWE